MTTGVSSNNYAKGNPLKVVDEPLTIEQEPIYEEINLPPIPSVHPAPRPPAFIPSLRWNKICIQEAENKNVIRVLSNDAGLIFWMRMSIFVRWR